MSIDIERYSSSYRMFHINYKYRLIIIVCLLLLVYYILLYFFDGKLACEMQDDIVKSSNVYIQNELELNGRLIIKIDSLVEKKYYISTKYTNEAINWDNIKPSTNLIDTLYPNITCRIYVKIEDPIILSYVEIFDFDYPRFIEIAICSDNRVVMDQLFDTKENMPLSINYSNGYVEKNVGPGNLDVFYYKVKNSRKNTRSEFGFRIDSVQTYDEGVQKLNKIKNIYCSIH